MSKSDGMKAFNLEMPDRVPRTEYSVLGHPALLERVTEIPVTSSSDGEAWRKAQQAFLGAWNFDFMWNTDIFYPVLGEYYTDMGHASYNADGSDFRAVGKSKFQDEEDVLKFDPWEALGERSQEETVAFFNQRYRENCEFWVTR